MDQLYTDFTTKLLPSIQAGLSITKDYFIDLFGRYVKYLLVTDSLLLAASVIGVIALPFVVKAIHEYGMKKKDSWGTHYDEVWPFFALMIALMGLLFCAIGIFVNAENLIKDVYIPEIRVYEELKPQLAPNNK